RALIRRLVSPERLSPNTGPWATYMPPATVITLRAAPRSPTTPPPRRPSPLRTWPTPSCRSPTAPPVPPHPTAAPAPPRPCPGPPRASLSQLARTTLGAANAWLVALICGVYAGQWMAVIGFLPTIYAAQGISGTTAGLLTAIVAGANAIGNLSAGRLLHRGVAGWQLLITGLATMILCAYAAFGAGLPAPAQFVAVLVFSLVGRLVPATLFVLGLTLAPTPQTASTTIGWMQQCSSLGQFAGPPFVAWVVNRAGGDWQWTWTATAAFAAAGIGPAALIGLRTRSAAPTR